MFLPDPIHRNGQAPRAERDVLREIRHAGRVPERLDSPCVISGYWPGRGRGQGVEEGLDLEALPGPKRARSRCLEPIMVGWRDYWYSEKSSPPDRVGGWGRRPK